MAKWTAPTMHFDTIVVACGALLRAGGIGETLRRTLEGWAGARGASSHRLTGSSALKPLDITTEWPGRARSVLVCLTHHLTRYDRKMLLDAGVGNLDSNGGESDANM